MPTETETIGRVAEPEIILQHYRRICEEHDNVEEAKAAETALIASAAASGVNVKALKMARKIEKMGPREGKTFLEDVLFYTNLISGGMMGQEELFPQNAGPVDDSVLSIQKAWNANREAEAAGYNAGKTGEPVDNNPNQQGTEPHQRWARAWADGREEYMVANGAKEISPRSDSRRPEARREEDDEESS